MASSSSSAASAKPASTAAAGTSGAPAPAPAPPPPVPESVLPPSTPIEPVMHNGVRCLLATAKDPAFEDKGPIYAPIGDDELRCRCSPQHLGPNVIYYNAADPEYYNRVPESPALTVWCLARSDLSTGYVKRRLFEAAFAKRIAFKVVATHKFELFATKDGTDHIMYAGKVVEPPDCVIVRVGAEVDYFGLAVIRQLEKCGSVIINNSHAVEISRDKLYTMQHLAGVGLPIPKTLLAKFPVDLDVLEREFEYPIIVKKASGSQGKGIIKVDSHEQMEDIVDMLDTKEPLIFQEFLEASKGRDLRVFVVGGRVVTAMMRCATKGFKANVHQGGSVKPVPLTAPVEWLCLEVVNQIGLDVAGVDLLIDTDSYKICEVNSSPGFEGLERATGLNVANQIMEYIRVRMGVYKFGRMIKKHFPIVPVIEDHKAPSTQKPGGGGSAGAGAGAGASSK